MLITFAFGSHLEFHAYMAWYDDGNIIKGFPMYENPQNEVLHDHISFFLETFHLTMVFGSHLEFHAYMTSYDEDNPINGFLMFENPWKEVLHDHVLFFLTKFSFTMSFGGHLGFRPPKSLAQVEYLESLLILTQGTPKHHPWKIQLSLFFFHLQP